MGDKQRISPRHTTEQPAKSQRIDPMKPGETRHMERDRKTEIESVSA